MNDSGTAERDGIDSYSDSAGHYNVESLSELNGDSVNDDHDFKCDDDDFPGSSNGVAASSIVHRKIADCLTRRSVLLDLSRQGLQSFPEEASDLQHIEVRYGFNLEKVRGLGSCNELLLLLNMDASPLY
jgi:hypothetical protein